MIIKSVVAVNTKNASKNVTALTKITVTIASNVMTMHRAAAVIPMNRVTLTVPQDHRINQAISVTIAKVTIMSAAVTTAAMTIVKATMRATVIKVTTMAAIKATKATNHVMTAVTVLIKASVLKTENHALVTNHLPKKLSVHMNLEVMTVPVNHAVW